MHAHRATAFLDGHGAPAMFKFHNFVLMARFLAGQLLHTAAAQLDSVVDREAIP
jgi:hypothetical protein